MSAVTVIILIILILLLIALLVSYNSPRIKGGWEHAIKMDTKSIEALDNFISRYLQIKNKKAIDKEYKKEMLNDEVKQKIKHLYGICDDAVKEYQLFSDFEFDTWVDLENVVEEILNNTPREAWDDIMKLMLGDNEYKAFVDAVKKNQNPELFDHFIQFTNEYDVVRSYLSDKLDKVKQTANKERDPSDIIDLEQMFIEETHQSPLFSGELGYQIRNKATNIIEIRKLTENELQKIRNVATDKYNIYPESIKFRFNLRKIPDLKHVELYKGLSEENIIEEYDNNSHVLMPLVFSGYEFDNGHNQNLGLGMYVTPDMRVSLRYARGVMLMYYVGYKRYIYDFLPFKLPFTLMSYLTDKFAPKYISKISPQAIRFTSTIIENVANAVDDFRVFNDKDKFNLEKFWYLKCEPKPTRESMSNELFKSGFGKSFIDKIFDEVCRGLMVFPNNIRDAIDDAEIKGYKNADEYNKNAFQLRLECVYAGKRHKTARTMVQNQNGFKKSELPYPMNKTEEYLDSIANDLNIGYTRLISGEGTQKMYFTRIFNYFTELYAKPFDAFVGNTYNNQFICDVRKLLPSINDENAARVNNYMEKSEIYRSLHDGEKWRFDRYSKFLSKIEKNCNIAGFKEQVIEYQNEQFELKLLPYEVVVRHGKYTAVDKAILCSKK